MRSRARGQQRKKYKRVHGQVATACLPTGRVALAALLLAATLLALVLWAGESVLLRGAAVLAHPHASLNGSLHMLSTGHSSVAKRRGEGGSAVAHHGPMVDALRGARGCQHFSVWCAQLDAVLASEARWRGLPDSQPRLLPWLQESGAILGSWLSSHGSREYADSMAGAIASGGSSGLHAVLLSTLHERQARVSPWSERPMVAVVRDAAVSEDGVVSAPVSGGRWGNSAETVVLPSCGSSGLMFKPVRPMWCTSHNAPVVVIAQPMCYGPAHFLAECLPRLLMALSAARREGALVHVTQANPMVSAAMDAVGLRPDRLVSGCVRAPRMLVPDGTFCGNPPASALLPMRRWAWSLSGACKDPARQDLLQAASRLLPEQDGVSASAAPDASWSADAEGACPAGLLSLGAAAAALGPAGAVSAWGSGRDAVQQAATCVLAHPQAVGLVAPAPGPIRVLFVRRSGSRRVENEGELLEALSHLEDVGQVTAFSPAGLQRDLEAFAAADVVLAPHGAGLANIVGCPPWAHVVELLARPVNIMYGSMCARLGLKWHALTPAVASHSGVIKAEVGLVVDRVREASKAIRDLAKRFASFSSSQRAVCAA